MAFRIVSIENPAEVHVRDGQLVVIQDKGTASIPVKDIKVLIVSGPSIRMSTMAQTILANNKVVTLFLGRNHHPAAMLLPIVAHSRQARVIQDQASMSPHLRGELWRSFVPGNRRRLPPYCRAVTRTGAGSGSSSRACATRLSTMGSATPAKTITMPSTCSGSTTSPKATTL